MQTATSSPRTLGLGLGLALVFALAGPAAAQPAPAAGSAAPSAGSAAPSAGSAAPVADSAPAPVDPSYRVPVNPSPGDPAPGIRPADPVPPAPPAPLPDPRTGRPEQLRQVCADAMNANPDFAGQIIRTINQQTFFDHQKRGAAIAKNERHVILAYAAMWLAAVGFLFGLWRRQQRLRAEIDRLAKQLATAEAKP